MHDNDPEKVKSYKVMTPTQRKANHNAAQNTRLVANTDLTNEAALMIYFTDSDELE